MKIKCNRCKILKEKHDFHKCKNKLFGISGYCKECRKEVDRLAKERKLEGTIKAF